MKAYQSIRTAQSSATDPRRAVQEFHAGVHQPDMELVVFFCSSRYDLEVLADEMNRRFAGTSIVGCTTAGEIGPSGYLAHSLTGASFPAGSCTTVIGFFKDLHDFQVLSGQAFTRSLLQQLEEPRDGSGSKAGDTFAFLLVDGLSTREEAVTRSLQNALGNIPMIGGSAGDDLKFSRTCVFYGGAFHSDAAVLTLVRTTYPFKIFKTQHFINDTERLVVTRADATRRIVYEINGLPAAQEYARLIGVPVDELTPARFAASPVVVLIDGTNYVRSIQQANPDGSLTFYCAIDEGLVFRVAHGEDLVDNLERTFATLRNDLGPPQVVFAYDCILRNLETAQQGQKTKVFDIFRNSNAVGFSTYGEQFCGMHVNQTLTGIAIGNLPTSGHQAEISRHSATLKEAKPPDAKDNPLIQGPMDELPQRESRQLEGESVLHDEIRRQNKIIEALMNRAEQTMGAQGSDFSMFQAAVLLENEVRARTRELEAAEKENERINEDLQRANRELEAFSYSVAHDLRAPLRSIMAFSRFLEHQCADQLNVEGHSHLQRIQQGAQRMGLLIDDLLRLSQCSRAELHWERMDLAALAREVIASRHQEQPERQLEFVVPESLPAHGDPRLMAIVLENLLGNAWKYSFGRAVTRIEFGFDPALSAYYVSDNGAGFDMAYAHKLFQVCQRLHKASEFEGTGIGLAIVQRIIERHGGRVWAEAKVNEGAILRFTLPEAAQPRALPLNPRSGSTP